MLDGKIKNQAVIFGDFKDITPTPDRIMSLLGKFRDKNMITGNFLEISPISQAPISRISLTTIDNAWAINIGSQRIDIFQNALDFTGKNIYEVSDFVREVIDISKRLLAEFAKKGNRIALVTEGFKENLTAAQFNTIYSKLRVPFGLYTSDHPFEWSTRDVCRKEFTNHDTKEIFNIITTLSRSQGQIATPSEFKQFDRFNINFDINTIPENTDSRFDAERCELFFTTALDIHTSIYDEITRSEIL